MAIEVRIFPSEALYLRDPQTTELGKKMLAQGITLLDELGLEGFTFRKLAEAVGCTEATVYRYFRSKHELLLYLVSWYWDWMHHLITQAALSEVQPEDKLRAAIRAMTQPIVVNPAVPFIDEGQLHRVVLTEGSKAYHTKEIDAENARNLFWPYKSLTADLSKLILAANPNFPYPRALASSLFEMAHNHLYFAEHLPRLTDLQHGEGAREQLEQMLLLWVERLVMVG